MPLVPERRLQARLTALACTHEEQNGEHMTWQGLLRQVCEAEGRTVIEPEMVPEGYIFGDESTPIFCHTVTHRWVVETLEGGFRSGYYPDTPGTSPSHVRAHWIKLCEQAQTEPTIAAIFDDKENARACWDALVGQPYPEWLQIP